MDGQNFWQTTFDEMCLNSLAVGIKFGENGNDL